MELASQILVGQGRLVHKFQGAYNELTELMETATFASLTILYLIKYNYNLLVLISSLDAFHMYQ